ncbi:structural protein [Synechococcus phage S-CAM7]|uniref:Structural protein n=1 Tax=Synechococcus phage S-CAM7 TaxID=1883368 RepID=A0A1D8KUF3_9CAUD|nr:structural protein [Synechococcus phage S-CAM7]
MIGTGIDVRVKIQDIVSSQLPEFILSEAPLTDDFLKQFYVSQEFQGGAIDFATNLDQYLDLNNLSSDSLYGTFELTQDISSTDTEVFVNTTKSFPGEWGLLKVNDEIMTYTGITTNSFTGVVRGFSGVTSLHAEGAPEEIVFNATEASSHLSGASVTNLSTLFLKEFYKKLSYTFAPGFEDLDVDSELDVGNWIRQVRSFFQTKGSEESIIILFKVLYGEKPTVIDLEDFLIKPSTAEYSRRDYAVAIPVEGNPIDLKGKTIFQVGSPNVFGAVSEIEAFTRDGRLYYRIYFFVSNEEVLNERKLFTIPGRTQCQREWNPGDTTLTVDTTIGFRDNGEFITADGIVFNYEQRSVNQFLGVTCSVPTKKVLITDEIIDNIIVSGMNDLGEEVTLRLTGVISDINFGDDIPFNFQGEKIRVDTLGESILSNIATRDESTVPEIIANSFVYNTSVRFEVESVNGTSFILSAPYLDKSSIDVGDTVDILPRGGQNAYIIGAPVTEVDFVNSTVTINNSFGIPVNQSLDIRRNQKYANSSGARIDYGNNAVLSNVLNLYDGREYDSNYYVATNSLPSYEISANIVESSLVSPTQQSFDDFNSFTGEYSTIIFAGDVNFYTGDLVTYSVSEGATSLTETGEYYVQVLSDRRKVKLFVSPSFIGSENSVGLVYTPDSGSHFFTLESQKTREISTKRIFRKIPVSDSLVAIDRTPEETTPGSIAVLTNGVEIVSYKSPNKVYLGPLERLDVGSRGEGYSVISPPKIYIAEPDVQLYEGGTGSVVPTKATSTPVIKGELEEILIDPQDFDIKEVFSITVRGGNSRGASAVPIIDKKNRELPFDSRVTTLGGGVNPDDNSILFQSNHNLTEGTALVYNNKGADSIGITLSDNTDFSTGATLSNGGVYYAKILNNRTIQLFETLESLNNGGDPVFLSSNLTGYGFQSFDTLRADRLIGATITDDGGDFFYRNMSFNPSNVFDEYDEIRYVSHGFNSGDIVEYGTTGTVISGMSTQNQYYVYKVNDNVLKLSDAGIGATISSNYDRLEFVDFNSSGTGTHNIKYPDITADVVVSFASSATGTIVASPIIRGSIEQVYTDDGGYYGSDIINFEKNPEVYPIGGSLAKLSPSIVNGIVNFVQIINTGKNYSDCPELVVSDSSGAGTGAKLRAVVVDGEIIDVIIISGGIGYNSASTTIEVLETGRDALIIPRIRDLTINLNSRFGFEVLSQNNYRIVSYNRVLREGVYSDVGNFHSPIIGWANDGNPIYGGFGFSDPQDTNSEIRAMETAYELAPNDVYGRPSQTAYPAGFFIEDYKYVDGGDLDEYNGRYCRTPDFPNGVYAYFAGISPDPQSSAREPQFPYFIGPKFRDSAIDSNSTNVDQSFDLNDKPIFRNTFPYYVGSPVAGSEFIDQSYLFDIQDSIVQSTSPGTIDSISIVGDGKDYSVGDVPLFNSDEDFISATISQVTGIGVSEVRENTLSYSKLDTAVIRLDQKTIRIYVSPNHQYNDNDSVIISGLSTITSTISGSRIVNIDNSAMTLYSPVQPIVNDGVTDIFVNSISQNVSVGSSIEIGNPGETELVSVLNIFPINKALRVYRPVGFNTVANIGDLVSPLPNFFDVNVRTPEFESELDYAYNFNPKQSLSIAPSLGESTSRVYSIGSIDYPISVPAASIYAPNHQFKNLEEVVFTKPANGISLDGLDSNNNPVVVPIIGDSQVLYVHNISKDYIGLRFTPSDEDIIFLTDASDLFTYSIKTNRFVETANLDRIRAEVTTIKPHQLKNNDTVTISVSALNSSGIGTASDVYIQFDEISQSLIVDPKFATSADISTELNLVFIEDHGYILGDYVLYECDGTSISGLTTHSKYFIIPFDTDRFYLAETAIDVKIGSELPIILGSTGSGEHKFSKVNPELNITGNHDILFDVSDPSLLNRELKFFYDQNLTEVFENNGIDPVFVVSGVSSEGTIGATKEIRFSENNPGVIYYGIESGGYISTSDTNAIAYNSIKYVNSVYSTKGTITSEDDNVFSLSLSEKPEVPLYTSTNSLLSYTTSSKNTVGGVGEVRIISSGNNFKTLPEFITIQSETGNNASLRANSSDIGRLSSFRIQNAGWAYSADKTLSPKGIVQPSIKFTNSDFVSSIDVINGGIGYQVNPDVVLIDAITRQTIDNGSLIANTQSSKIVEIEIDVAPSGLSKNPHELYTTNNGNGIPILEIIDIDSTSAEVVFSLQTPIIGYASTPFEIGDQVFIENIFSDSTDSSNLNSSDYGYSFFDVVSVISSNPTIITVKYPESAVDNIYTGIGATNQGAFSSIVNRKNYPEFQVNQTTAVFVIGERLSVIIDGDDRETDLIIEESNTNFFKVSGNYDLLTGDTVRGNVSGIEATVTDIDKSFCRYVVDTVSRTSIGWRDSIGFTNDEFQVTPNNDYYQNLSYSIKSTIGFETLIGPVNRLVHPAGLKNFSDTKIESIGVVGLGTTAITTDPSITIDFIGLTDVSDTPLRVDRINVFDLGYDSNVNNNKTNEIRFNSATPEKRLTNYFEVKTNRVLLIDDISSSFIDSDNLRAQNDFIDFDVITSVYTRGIIQVRNPSTDQVQLSEIISLTYDDNAYTLSKASVYDGNVPHGIFQSTSLTSSDYTLRFIPTEPDTFDMDLKLLTQKFDSNSIGAKELGYVTLGGLARTAPALSSTLVYSAPNNSINAVALQVYVQKASGQPSYYEVYAFVANGEVLSKTYNFTGDPIRESNSPGFDFISILDGGGKIRISVENTDADFLRINTRELEYKATASGENPYRFKKDNIFDGSERGLNLLSEQTVGSTTDSSINVLTLNSELFQTAKLVVYIEGTTIGAIHQVMVANSDGSTYNETYPFITEGDGSGGSGIGTFGATINGSDWNIEFYPDSSFSAQSLTFTTYAEAFYREYDAVNYDPRPLTYQNNEEAYFLEIYNTPLGNRTNKVSFPIQYNGIPVYEKGFDPIAAIDDSSDVISLNNHFFSDSEELYYEFGDTVSTVIPEAIGIVPVIDYLGISTDKMPSKVWAIKIDLNKFRVSATKEDADRGIYIDIVDFGVGNNHKFGMEKKLEKSLYTIDGVIQSPIAQANLVYELDSSTTDNDKLLQLVGISSITAGDILLVDEEYIIIEDVGFAEQASGPISNTGSIPLIEVKRGTLGSLSTSHSAGAEMFLFRGSYNIVGNNLIFTEAPNGSGPQQPNQSNLVVVNSSFQGRVFLQQNYDKIAIFDDISSEFDGTTEQFKLTSGGITTGGVENGSGVLIINDIYQTPTTTNNEGNNYYFTDAEKNIVYSWSDLGDTSQCLVGEIRISDSEDEIGLSNIDLNSIDQEAYFNTLVAGDEYVVNVKYSESQFEYRGNYQASLPGNTTRFVGGSVISGIVTTTDDVVDVTIVPVIPKSDVVFTGIRSPITGLRVESEFDVNQNQIPRGGLIVSLGSTPGLGYAPLVDAILEPEVVSGEIVGVYTGNNIGETTQVRWAVYDNETGELTVSFYGNATTAQEPVSGAVYFKESGRLLVTTPASLSGQSILTGDLVSLDALLFECSSGGAPSQQIFPDRDSVFTIESIVNDNTFSVSVGISTLDHTYIAGGTWQKVLPFEFGRQELNPSFVYLNNLEFECPSGQTAGLTTTLFPTDTNNFPVITRDDGAHLRLQVGISTLVHNYVGGGTIGEITKNSVGSGYNSVVSIGITEAGHTGAAASIRGIPGPGGELQIVIDDPGSGYVDPYIWAPSPNYFNLPIKGISRRDGTTDTGKNLFVTCEVGGATTTAIGKSEYFEVINYEISNLGYGFMEGDVVTVVGLVTDKSLSQPIEEFQLTVLDTFTDNFSYWNYGQQDYIDSISSLQDGIRTRFPLIYNGELLSFEKNPLDEDSDAIDLNSILLIYVNSVLQVPEVAYRFNGGTSFEFTEPPLPADDIDIYFYRGNRDLDSIEVTTITESIRPGDDLQIMKNDVYDLSKTQDIRLVTQIKSSDTVRTNIYSGNRDLDTINPRPVAWDKQKRDIFIYGEPAFKTRDSLESDIRPDASIISPLNSSSINLYIDSPQLFRYEQDVDNSVEDISSLAANIYGQSDLFTNTSDTFEEAEIKAVVNANGQVSDLQVINPGRGYPTDTQITISSPVDGSRAFLTNKIIIGGTIIFVSTQPSGVGSGYDPANPPIVLIERPAIKYESGIKFNGDNVRGYSAAITRIVGAPSPNFSVPYFLRFYFNKLDDSQNINDILVGDYIVTSQTNIGSGVNAIGGNQLDLVGTSNQFLDCVYKVSGIDASTYEYIDVNVTTNVSGIDVSGDLGYFSFGVISNVSRPNGKTFDIPNPEYTNDMDNFPTLVRTKGGLRDRGGLAKKVVT